MDSPSEARPNSQLRRMISTTFERLRQHTPGLRARRDQPVDDEEDSYGHVIVPAPAAPPPGKDETIRQAEGAMAVLRELLLESIPFARPSVFYPPHATLSPAKQGAIHEQLVDAFLREALRGVNKPSGSSGSAFRRTPKPAPPPTYATAFPERRPFTRFPDLPTEIRLQIWEAALPVRGRRTLHIGQSIGEPYCWTARLPMPTLARVCRESRAVVLGRGGVFPSTAAGRADYRPMGLQCGDFLQHIGRFYAAAHSLTSVLLPGGLGNELRRGDQLSTDVWRGAVKRLMVVVQVVYIALPAPPAELADEEMEAYRQELPDLDDDAVVVRDVRDVAGPRAQPLDAVEYRAAVHRRLRNHHIAVVASLHDRARVRELLSLGDATRFWPDRRARLQSLYHHTNAFCMDCLLYWWDSYARQAALEALLAQTEGLGWG
ncbi:unnamed protein product [Parascedosporium putredinis]|uniref:2EXR domain-containing protein n=1 Tax=Parascedosporium putredinis TaxID=1442378 RepID=A0A9P1HAQ3_9PEZI|nr:unnamed protein product [Parascedosporium putredinis]CAI8004225.1 unnamed protein product [Parascedosporium putredinis]